MARLIYAFLALSLGTLVAGFLIRDSSVPLLVSIGLSAIVLVMILVGTSRRLRRANEFEDERTELAELEIVEVDEEDVSTSEVGAEATARKPRPGRRRRTVTVEADTQSMQTIEEILAADEALDQTADTESVIATPARTRRTSSAKTRPSRRRARPEPSEPDAELAPMLEIEEAEAEPTDVVVPEPVAAAEPPLTIEMPPPRKSARRRRSAPAHDIAATAAIDRPTARPAAAATAPGLSPPGLSPPGLSPKVWVIPGRSRYHTHDCRFAKGDTLREVTEATAQRRGYVPCNVCKPGSE